jgi:hypothetical protein
MPNRSKTPSGAKCGKKHSKYIARHQARNLLHAVAFADQIGLRLNVAVDINWLMFSGTVDDRTRFAQCQQRLSKWAKRRGFALTLIWTREVGKYGSPHTHVLIHLRPWLMQSNEFQLALERALEPEGGSNHEKAIMIRPAYRPLGKLLYNLKGVDPKHASGFGIRPAYQGEVLGKRAGCTENIGAGARRKASTTREVEPTCSGESKDTLSTGISSGNSETRVQNGRIPTSKFVASDAHSVARRLQPHEVQEKPPKKDANGSDARKTELAVPPAEVIAGAIELYRSDKRGRWSVGNYLPSGRRRAYSFDISYAEVQRLLRLLWPKYIADQKRTADRCYGGDVSRVAPSWRPGLEAALDREAKARREFGARREKWEQRQRELERLRRQRMSPEQRRELERKEHDERMRVLSAEYDERDLRYARKTLLDIKLAISKGRSESQYRHLLDGIAAAGPDGATALDIAYIAVVRHVRGLRLNPPDEVERWGNDIAQALAARGLVCAIAPDRFIRPGHKGVT